MGPRRKITTQRTSFAATRQPPGANSALRLKCTTTIIQGLRAGSNRCTAHTGNLKRRIRCAGRKQFRTDPCRSSPAPSPNHANNRGNKSEIKTGRDIDLALDSTSKRRDMNFRAAFLLLQLRRRWQSFRVGISLRQFEQMKERVGGKSPREVFPPAPPHRVSRHQMKSFSALTRRCAARVSASSNLANPFPETLAHGTISCPKNWERSRCLAKISQTLRDEIAKTSADRLRDRRTFLRAKSARPPSSWARRAARRWRRSPKRD